MGQESSGKSKRNVIIALVLFVIVAVIIAVVFMFNKPVEDLTIVKDFAALQGLTDNYYLVNNKLPATLAELNYKTAETYDYQIVGGSIYKLCTNFSADVTDDINKQAGITVNYHKGQDCVTFNAASGYLKNDLVKKENDLQLLESNFTIRPATGVVQGNLNYNIDTKQSRFYKNKTTGDYLVDLYVSVLGGAQCVNASQSNKQQCCYSWSSISAKSVKNNTDIFHNKLGSSSYIVPFPKDDQNTFGDLPMSFCLAGSKQIFGGISLVVPGASVNNNSVDLSLQINEPKASAATLNVKISPK